MMDYKKFTAQIEKEVAQTTAEREALENKVSEAQKEAAAAEEKCNQIAQGDDVDAYLTAKTAAAQAAERADFYSMKLNSKKRYVYTLEQLYNAREKLSNSYGEEQDELEKAMKESLDALQKKLLPLVQKFADHRAAGNSALRKMATLTDPTDSNNNGMQANIVGIEGYYNTNNDIEKLLKVIDAILNDKRYITVNF